MSDRRRLSPEARREQLEQATLDVVSAVGYAAAGAEAIAAAAGVSKGLLWHYYDDLDALLAAAARSGFGQLQQAVVATVDVTAPVPDLLWAAVHRAATLPRTHGTQLRAIRQIVTGLRRPDGSPVLDEGEYAPLHAAQEAMFRRGQAAGQVRPGLDPRLLAITYQGTVDAMVDQLVRHPDADPEALADVTATVLLGGLGLGRS